MGHPTDRGGSMHCGMPVSAAESLALKVFNEGLRTISAEWAFHWGSVLGKELQHCVKVVMVRKLLLWFEQVLESEGRRLLGGTAMSLLVILLRCVGHWCFHQASREGHLRLHGMVVTELHWWWYSSRVRQSMWPSGWCTPTYQCLSEYRGPNCPTIIQGRAHEWVVGNGLCFFGAIRDVSANKVQCGTRFPSYGTGVSIPKKVIADGQS